MDMYLLKLPVMMLLEISDLTETAFTFKGLSEPYVFSRLVRFYHRKVTCLNFKKPDEFIESQIFCL